MRVEEDLSPLHRVHFGQVRMREELPGGNVPIRKEFEGEVGRGIGGVCCRVELPNYLHVRTTAMGEVGGLVEEEEDVAENGKIKHITVTYLPAIYQS